MTATRWLGRSLARTEDERLLTGRGRYLADIGIVGGVAAAFVRSPLPHARIVAVHTSAAAASDGVLAVLTAEDVPHEPLVDAVMIDGLAKTPQPALARDRVRFVGEPIAIVLADSIAQAEDGADLVELDFQPLPVVTDSTDVSTSGDALLFPELGTNVIYRGRRSYGDAEAAFRAAAHVASKRFRSGRSAAVPLEARGCIAEFDAAGRLVVTSSTQSPHLLRRRLAGCLGLGEHQVRVVVPDVGGAFGQKIPAAPEEIAVALASRVVQRPVTWIEDRRENLLAAPHAKEQTIDLSLAVDENGTFTALRAQVVGDAGAYSFNSASALIEPYVGAGLLPGVYRIRHVEVDIVSALTNKSPIAPYRGVGWTATHTARELLIDDLARDLGVDPVALRRQNLVRPEDFPYDSATGMHYDSGSFQESLDSAIEMIDYTAFRGRQAERRHERRYIGIGISPYVEPTGWGSEGAAQSAWSFASHDVVRVSVEPSGHVIAACGTPSQGQGHATTLAQVVADAVGVSPDQVTVLSQDTDATPVSTAGTRASRVAVISGGALHEAGVELNERLRRIAGAMLEVDAADLEVLQGEIRVVGDSATSVPIRRVAETAYFEPDVREQVPDPNLTVTRFLDPKATYSNGVIVVTVEVDVETGGIHVNEVVVVEDCGTMINPRVVDGQIRGAVAQGIGAALLERMSYDADGQLQTTSFMDYLLPTMTDVPRIRITHHHSPSPYTVNGVKGLGESGLIATPAAVANAVADALSPFGAKVDRLPLTPQSVTDLVEGATVGEASQYGRNGAAIVGKEA